MLELFIEFVLCCAIGIALGQLIIMGIHHWCISTLDPRVQKLLVDDEDRSKTH